MFSSIISRSRIVSRLLSSKMDDLLLLLAPHSSLWPPPPLPLRLPRSLRRLRRRDSLPLLHPLVPCSPLPPPPLEWSPRPLPRTIPPSLLTTTRSPLQSPPRVRCSPRRVLPLLRRGRLRLPHSLPLVAFSRRKLLSRERRAGLVRMDELLHRRRAFSLRRL